MFGETCSQAKLQKIFEKASDILAGRDRCSPDTRRNQECQEEARVLVEMINIRASESGINLTQSTANDGRNDTESSDWSEPGDPDYVEEALEKEVRSTKLSVMRTIVRLSETRSEKGIQGSYKWYRRQYLKGFKIAVANGGTLRHKMADINDYTFDMFKKARESKLPVRGWTLQDWAMERAIEVNHPSFKASRGWLDNFKKQLKIRGRKVTKTTTRSQREKVVETDESIRRFQAEYSRLSTAYDASRIFNFDQTAFNYEMHNLRTLSHQGERDTEMEADSINKQTHSYTAQVVVSRDGSTVGKLLLCLQEDVRRMPSNVNHSDDTFNFFGPKTQLEVSGFEDRFKNVRVYASKSGKMSAELTKMWMRQVLQPAIHQHANNRSTLILADSWSGQNSQWVTSFLNSVNSELLIIPPRTTGDLQPLDVGFNRQYKIIVKRITERARLEKTIGLLTSRAGIINLQSLVYNQLSSPAYNDIIRYSWRKADSQFNITELTRFPPANANAIQFERQNNAKCSVPGCTRSSLMRCSHCGKVLCLNHFLERTCFHHNEPNRLPDFVRNLSISEDDLDDDDLYEIA